MVVTLDSAFKHLQDVETTQERIETLSLWIMHHKDRDSIQVIVDAWLQSFKQALSDQRKTALFFLMNDVVQKAKNKHVDHIIPCFQPAVLQAVTLGRSSSTVKRAMERCLDIFTDRHVFSQASVASMKNLLNSEGDVEGDDSCLELDSEDFVHKIELFLSAQEYTTKGLEIMRKADFDFAEHAKTRMRDRNEALEMVNETQEGLNIIVELRHAMEEQKRKMYELLETASLAKRVFAHQQKEVAVVHDAYDNFHHGILNVRRELLEIEKCGIYPGATPPRDAPSPTANDDIYATGVESALQTLRNAGIGQHLYDNRDDAAMDVGDDDEDVFHSPPKPTKVIAPHPDTTLSWKIPTSNPSGIPLPGVPPPVNSPPLMFLPSVPPPGFLPNIPPPGAIPPMTMPPPAVNIPNLTEPPPTTSANMYGSNFSQISPTGRGGHWNRQSSAPYDPRGRGEWNERRNTDGRSSFDSQGSYNEYPDDRRGYSHRDDRRPDKHWNHRGSGGNWRGGRGDRQSYGNSRYHGHRGPSRDRGSSYR